MNRRQFIQSAGLAVSVFPAMNYGIIHGEESGAGRIVTVSGEISSTDLGFTLTHEHILVDFTGAEHYNPAAWDRQKVIETVIPYIKQIREFNCASMVECTPEYIGRDPVLLKRISDMTGIQILTNTGYYGASGNKYLPSFVFKESAEKLAKRWILEFKKGIGDTGIKPGFIKIGVDPGNLSGVHKKLVMAAAVTHLETGLTIASHTGPALPAFQELNILEKMKVRAEAFLWVHAQNEKDQQKRIEAAVRGTWISLDGLNDDDVPQYVSWLSDFYENGLLHKVLVSHDAGWYTPGETDGGDFRPYTTVFKKLIPALYDIGFTENEIKTIFITNPAKALSIDIRRI